MNIISRFSLFVFALLTGALFTLHVWFKPIIPALTVSPPLLALLFAALIAVVVGVAIVSRLGALRHLRSGKVFHWIAPGALVPLLIVFFAVGCGTDSPGTRTATTRAAGIGPTQPRSLLTNATPILILAGHQSNIVAGTWTEVSLTHGKGLAVQFRGFCTNGSVSNILGQIVMTVDGTNWDTGRPLVLAGVATGTTEFLLSSNFPSWLTDNYQKARFYKFTNGATSAVFLTNAIARVTQ